jgi:O-antigen biosynthesis protein
MFLYKEELLFNPSPHSPHSKIIRCIGDNKKVLDIGCSSGYIAKELTRKNCSIIGIEVDETSAEAARKYCDEVVVADVETIKELHFPEKSFDVLIFSDVLEHLKRPDLVLMNFKKYLKPEGFAIASIPNIARFEYRTRMLLGKFTYEKGGIMNRGHLRFFTLKTAKELFESSGYTIGKIYYTGLGSKLRILPTWFAFQFVIIAKRDDIE